MSQTIFLSPASRDARFEACAVSVEELWFVLEGDEGSSSEIRGDAVASRPVALLPSPRLLLLDAAVKLLALDRPVCLEWNESASDSADTFASSSLHTASCPWRHAITNASSSAARGSLGSDEAPADRRALVAWTKPCSAASCSGEHPNRLRASASAPSSSSASAASSDLSSSARVKNVPPLRHSAVMSKSGRDASARILLWSCARIARSICSSCSSGPKGAGASASDWL
mmetsp:Transcript_24567/g.41916  ORF Transcript_24567/g.41916 Transcript_24567/m.41916 type:complete len:229 (+) Transcript_24567:3446-4132(+)